MTESTQLGDGTPLVGSRLDSQPGALGFADYMSATSSDGTAIVKADSPTTPSGDLGVSSEAGQVTTETVTTTTLFLQLYSGQGQAFLTLDAAVVGDNQDPADLIADLNAAISSNGLAEQVTARLNAGHVEFVSADIGSGSWLGTYGWSQSTSVSTTTFTAAGSLDRDLGPGYGDSVLGFGSVYAIGTDRSYIVAQVPPPGWLPTTNVVEHADGPIGLQAVQLAAPGQAAVGVNFGTLSYNNALSSLRGSIRTARRRRTGDHHRLGDRHLAGPNDESDQTLWFEITGNTNPDLFTAGPTLDAATGNLSFTAADNSHGAATITLRLRDDGGTDNGGSDTSVETAFTITVVPVNDPPSFTAGDDQTVSEDAGPQTVAGWASKIFAGPANESVQSLWFEIINVDNSYLFDDGPTLDAETGDLRYTLAANANGMAKVTVVLKDDGETFKGGTDTSLEHVFTITVTPQSDPPVLAAIGDQFVKELATLTFTVSASDPDLSADTHTYSVSNLPEGASFDPATRQFSWTPSEVQGPGSYPVTFTVSDGTATDEETIKIHVAEVNQPPVLAAIGNREVNELAELAFTVSADDPDLPANTLTFSAGNLPEGAAFDPATRQFSWTPSETQGPGSYQVTFTVSDGTASHEETITISVDEVNQPQCWRPSANAC